MSLRPLVLLPLALLLGCPSETPDPTETDTPAPTGDTATPAGARTDVTGTVRGTDGSPIEGALIRFCRGALCLNGETDAAGAFGFEDVEAAATSLEIIAPDGTDYATAFSAVELEEDVPRSFEMTLLQPDVPSTLGAEPTWHTVGTGLRVEASAADIEPPLFVDPTTEIHGVFVPEADHPELDGLTGVLGVWFVGPFDHHAPNGLPMEIDNTFGLSEGDTVTVRVGDYASSTWLDAGTLTVSGDVLTGTTLPLLSTVVITQP